MKKVVVLTACAFGPRSQPGPMQRVVDCLVPPEAKVCTANCAQSIYEVSGPKRPYEWMFWLVTKFGRGLGALAMKNRVTIQDSVFLAGAFVCVGFLAFEYDVFREESVASAERQRLSLNEVLGLGAFLVVGLLVFSWRRMDEYKKELTRRVVAEQNAHASARHDSLTGLPNRRLFTERAGEALGRAWSKGSQCAVLFIDLDGFKPVNDTFGHSVGDALLVEIANRLRSCFPEPASVARLGGDEFAALVEFTDGADVPGLAAKRILREIQQPIIIDGKSMAVGATVGVAVGPASGRRAEDLIHAADLAMYDAKRSGRGTIRVFEATPSREVA
jgi:diguanylate cyclase